MRQHQPNILNELQHHFLNNPDFAESTGKTYWSDLGVVVRAVLESHDNDVLQSLIEKSGYSGDYRSAINHARKIVQQTQIPHGEKIDRLKQVPTAESFAEAFQAIGITDKEREILLANYYAPYRTATATDLAEVSQIQGGYNAVNSLYGKLAHKLCDYLGVKIEPNDIHGQWWPVLAIGYNTERYFHWQLRDEVAEALEILKWTN
jgi:hypothetical protein